MAITNDKLGRKHSITLGSAIMAVGVIVQTVATNVGTFMAARFILGFGIPFAIGGASMLIAELVYPKHTSVINGLFNEVSFHILVFS